MRGEIWEENFLSRQGMLSVEASKLTSNLGLRSMTCSKELEYILSRLKFGLIKLFDCFVHKLEKKFFL